MMPDDPRAILKAAGVECPEVEARQNMWACVREGAMTHEKAIEDDAILALARLVAKYKEQRDAAMDVIAYRDRWDDHGCDFYKK